MHDERQDDPPDAPLAPARPLPASGSLVRRAVGALLPRRRNLRGTVYLVLDHSTSMADPGKMDQLRQGALRFFLEAVQRDHAVGAVAFSYAAQLVYGAGLDAHRFWQRLHGLRPYGRTAMAAGLRLALWRLRFRSGRKVIVLITDGMPDDREATLDAARIARARGVTLIPIGTGAADFTFLASLAGRPELARHVETRDRVPARARIGGTIATLGVTEGDRVEAGAALAMIEDVKLGFQIDALEARIQALESRLATAQSDLDRGTELFSRGVITSQRLEELETSVRVIEGDLSSVEAERSVVEQRIEEGEVLAPDTGIVLSVPLSPGSVVTPGETVAEIAGGGVFLRLSVPERFAGELSEGDRIEISSGGDTRSGVLAKLYPQIAGGRLEADVEVEGLDPRFVGRRVPVRLPVGQRMAILVPQAALSRTGGLDFVTVQGADGPVRRVVVPGAVLRRDGAAMREILSGLAPGDVLVIPDE